MSPAYIDNPDECAAGDVLRGGVLQDLLRYPLSVAPVVRLGKEKLGKTSTPIIGAWKCNFPPF